MLVVSVQVPSGGTCRKRTQGVVSESTPPRKKPCRRATATGKQLFRASPLVKVSIKLNEIIL